MKTRPIHNNIFKWAKQAKSKVKSIVEWIKTGRNNNREVLQKLDKRYRDHFDTKSTINHNKPQKKTKEGTVKYIPN